MPKVKSYGNSDVGLARLANEDVWAQMLPENFFILCDGMGGHKAGEVAARETVLQLCCMVKQDCAQLRTIAEWETLLKGHIKTVNAHVLKLGAENKETEGMGTTLCLALIVDGTLVYAHVGDSRIYQIRKGRITQLTRDHSLRSDLIASGELDESLALLFPYKNVITRAIGTKGDVTPEIDSVKIEKGDIFFLCTDGLTNELTDAHIHELIRTSPSVQEAVENLISAAKMSGGNDNITVILFEIS